VAGDVLTDELLKTLPSTAGAGIRRSLLRWYRRNGRAFPWRKNAAPWEVLLTEILLRKTGAGLVAREGSRFLRKYGSPQQLLEADREEVACDLHVFGLRYQRADQLQALASALINRHAGQVPKNLGALLALPAVGKYASKATQVFGFAIPGTVVDTNTIRVLGRIFHVRSSMLEARKDRRFQGFADSLASRRRPKEFNWAILDLAALVCVPKNPLCEECPVLRFCRTGLRVAAPGGASHQGGHSSTD